MTALAARNRMRSALEAEDYDAVLALFDEDASAARRLLVRLTYNPDTVLHDRAIRALRHLSACRGAQQREFFLEIMRRHLWGMNEEGGNVDWSAPEIIAAVIAGQPNLFGQFASYMVATALEEPLFHPSLLAAADMLSRENQDLIRDFMPALQEIKRNPQRP